MAGWFQQHRQDWIAETLREPDILSAEQLAKGDDFRQLLDMSDRRGIEWMHTIVRGIAAIQGRTVCR